MSIQVMQRRDRTHWLIRVRDRRSKISWIQLAASFGRQSQGEGVEESVDLARVLLLLSRYMTVLHTLLMSLGVAVEHFVRYSRVVLWHFVTISVVALSYLSVLAVLAVSRRIRTESLPCLGPRANNDRTEQNNEALENKFNGIVDLINTLFHHSKHIDDA